MPRNPNKTDYSGGLPVGFESFGIIEDPRTGGNKRHYFGEVIFMSISAMLCGMNNFAEVVAFCEEQTDWLKKWIRLPNGVPRAQTFYNIFSLIDPKSFNRCILEHLGSISPGLREQVIALDGKSLRGSHTLKQGPVHTVSAWASQQRITLCQEHLRENENEIGAIKRLLDQPEIEGQTITIDAIGTQREIAGKIIAKKAHYLLALKSNQPALNNKQSTSLTLDCAISTSVKPRGGASIKTGKKLTGVIPSAVSWQLTNSIGWRVKYGRYGRDFAALSSSKIRRLR